MNIYGVGYKQSSSKCYQFLLLNHFKDKLKEFQLRNYIPKDANIVIINIDVENTYRILDNFSLPPDDAYVVMIVYELDQTVIPYLKLADLVVYTNELQLKLVKDFLGLNHSNLVLPLPTGDFTPSKPDKGSCLIFCNEFLNAKKIPEIIDRAAEIYHWTKEKEIPTDSLALVLPGFNQFDIGWHQLELALKKIESNCKIYNSLNLKRNEWISILGNATSGHFLSLSLNSDDFDKLIVDQDKSILFQMIKGASQLSDFQYAEIPHIPTSDINAWSSNLNYKITFDEFCNQISDRVLSEYPDRLNFKKQRFSKVIIDKLSDLNIVYGAPLSNRYIFYIYLRNVEKNIERCLNSILVQNRELDFGIVIIDDQSNDKSLDLVLHILKKYSDVDICIVSNNERLYTARNIYNVAHLLTMNNESVIIEVDGNDFLRNNQVLEVLDRYYSLGTTKTCGSFNAYPQDSQLRPEGNFKTNEQVSTYHTKTNFDRPRNSSLCSLWLPLKTCKRHLLCKVELPHFMDRHTNNWLTIQLDLAIQPRLIELSQGKTVFIPEILYCYNITDEYEHSTETKDAYIHSFFINDKFWYAIR